MFDGIFWIDIGTGESAYTTPDWAVGPTPEQNITPIQFVGVDMVATGTNTGQILVFKIHENKPTSTLDLHGGERYINIVVTSIRLIIPFKISRISSPSEQRFASCGGDFRRIGFRGHPVCLEGG
jgi:hypothetical protein